MKRVKVIQGDITKLKVDAIVNAANTSLLGGGGVDGAIHLAGGSQILEECRKIGGCDTGDAVITSAGNLPAKYVIHTVGPIWKGGNEDEAEQLKNCYLNSMKLATENNCKTIAFPGISTGVYGYPKDKAAQIAVSTLKDYLNEHPEIEEVLLVSFDADSYHILKKELESAGK